MAFIQLEDMDTSAEIILFPRTFAKVEQWLDDYHVFIVKGGLDLTASNQCKIKANELVPVELVLQEWPRMGKASFTLPQNIEEEALKALKEKLVRGTIPLEFIMHENGQKLRLTTKGKIALDADMVKAIENDYNVNIQCVL